MADDQQKLGPEATLFRKAAEAFAQARTEVLLWCVTDAGGHRQRGDHLAHEIKPISTRAAGEHNRAHLGTNDEHPCKAAAIPFPADDCNRHRLTRDLREPVHARRELDVIGYGTAGGPQPPS